MNNKPKASTRTGIDWEIVLIVAVLVMMFTLFLTLLAVPLKSHASACLTIDVPPQAVTNVHDGDTFTLFTFAPGGTVQIRVQDVDAIELRQPGGVEAREFTKAWLSKGMFTLQTCGVHTFERIVGIVGRNGVTLAQDLIAAGHSKKEGGK